MPKLPVLSGAEAVRALEPLGFEQKGRRGSHVVLRNGDAGCVVPLHKKSRKGTLAGIIRQAGLTKDEFLGGLEKP
ncbi:MAG: type II toxin-antitoxin system HicA family toxin [Sphingomonadales bacterium]|nr:type II toxin-antitoxin system HicA family toxin [Sphingomonadales bacterium]